MREQGLADDCGIAVLASRAVGVPFVSLTAAAFVIAELLRRLHGGNAFEVVSGSLLDLSSIPDGCADRRGLSWRVCASSSGPVRNANRAERHGEI